MMIDIQLDVRYHLSVNAGFDHERVSPLERTESSMRKSKEEAAETRDRIVEAAAAEFRQNEIGRAHV